MVSRRPNAVICAFKLASGLRTFAMNEHLNWVNWGPKQAPTESHGTSVKAVKP
jgi:hypothetical protein